jgi:hypothetical protein
VQTRRRERAKWVRIRSAWRSRAREAQPRGHGPGKRRCPMGEGVSPRTEASHVTGRDFPVACQRLAAWSACLDGQGGHRASARGSGAAAPGRQATEVRQRGDGRWRSGLVPCRSPRLRGTAWSRARGPGGGEDVRRAWGLGGPGKWRQSVAPEAVSPLQRAWGAVGSQGVEASSGGRPARRQKQIWGQSQRRTLMRQFMLLRSRIPGRTWGRGVSVLRGRPRVG